VNHPAAILAVVVISTAIFQILWPGWMGYWRGQIGIQSIDWITLLVLAVAALVVEVRNERRREREARSRTKPRERTR
jgi:uncharacterized membrane protein